MWTPGEKESFSWHCVSNRITSSPSLCGFTGEPLSYLTQHWDSVLWRSQNRESCLCEETKIRMGFWISFAVLVAQCCKTYHQLRQFLDIGHSSPRFRDSWLSLSAMKAAYGNALPGDPTGEGSTSRLRCWQWLVHCLSLAVTSMICSFLLSDWHIIIHFSVVSSTRKMPELVLWVSYKWNSSIWSVEILGLTSYSTHFIKFSGWTVSNVTRAEGCCPIFLKAGSSSPLVNHFSVSCSSALLLDFWAVVSLRSPWSFTFSF